MPTRPSIASMTAVLAMLVAPSASFADDAATGGLSMPERPEITTLSCSSDGASERCPRGQVLEVRGDHLKAVKAVVFLGRAGSRDDRRARPIETSNAELSVTVPAGAKSGPVRALTSVAGASAPSRVVVRVTSQVTRTSVAGASDEAGVFPIQGQHDMGQSATNRFGGGRGHQGQDMFAACGTPLVAVRAGRVQRVATQSRAGNYVVLQDANGQSYAYMHMAKPSALRVGADVAAGDVVGQVGDSGRATGCHLHFEIWTAPGWYLGGKPIDPLPQLRLWDAGGHGG